MFTREAALWPAALWVRTTRVENALLLQGWLERVHAPLAVEVEAASAAERLAGMRLDTPELSHAERKALWEKHLGGQAAEMNGALDTMVDVFGLDAAEIPRDRRGSQGRSGTGTGARGRGGKRVASVTGRGAKVAR